MTQLAQVDTFADLPLAELVQLQLKEIGIDSWLENATLVAWFWQLGFAVGGIKLFVKAEDLAPAREALADPAPDPAPDVPQPPEFCPQCHEPLLPMWETCWRCAQLPPEQSSEISEADRMRSEDWERTITAITAAIVGLATFMACGPIWLLFVVGCFAVVKLIFEFGAIDRSAVAAEPSRPDAEDSPPTLPHSELVEDMARRAWRASVIGFLYFPPLGFYGLNLALQIKPRATPLSAAGRWRRFGALAVGLAIVFFWALIFFLIVFEVPTFSPDMRKSPWSLEH